MQSTGRVWPGLSSRDLLSIGFAGAMACASPTRTPSEDARPALDTLVPALLDSAGVPGLALVLVSRGKIVWAQGFGNRRQGDTEPIDTATVFEAASLGKPVFAYAVMKLIDEGRFDLDRPLALYQSLPDLSQDPRYQRITARMILSHTSGLPNEVRPGEHLSLQFDPGTRFGYSGAGFVYLQRVIEGVMRMPLDSVMRLTVFGSLDMTRSSYRWQPRFAANFATGHDDYETPRPPTKPTNASAAASLHTGFIADVEQHRQTLPRVLALVQGGVAYLPSHDPDSPARLAPGTLVGKRQDTFELRTTSFHEPK